MNLDELRALAASIKWWHRIDLGNGIVTPGVCQTKDYAFQIYGIPNDLSGMSVLDIGAWDGFYSFAAERRGARRVLATDAFCWGENPWASEGFGTKAGFDLARKALNSQVEDQKIDVLELSPEKVGTFDLVLFLGGAVPYATPAAGPRTGVPRHGETGHHRDARRHTRGQTAGHRVLSRH